MRLHSDQHTIASFLPNVSLARVVPEYVAPYIPDPNKKIRKQTKTFFLGRDVESAEAEEETGAAYDVLKRRVVDIDAQPWLLQNSDQTIAYLGKQQQQSQSYVLFNLTDRGFAVSHCNKHYSFYKKPAHATLTIEEAEAQMAKTQKKTAWTMKSLRGEAGQEELNARSTAQNVMRLDYGEEGGQDYQDEVQDDDGLIDLGFENEEEGKEAEYRTAGGKASMRMTFEEDLTTKKKSTDKTLKKTLRRQDNSMNDSDDEDPYASEESDEDAEETVAVVKKVVEVVYAMDVDKKDVSPFEPINASPEEMLAILANDKKARSPLQSNSVKSRSPAQSNSAKAKSPLQSSKAKTPLQNISSPATVSKKASPINSYAKSPLSNEMRVASPLSQSLPKIKLKISGLSTSSSPAQSNESDLKRKRSTEPDTKKTKPFSPQYSPQSYTPQNKSMSPNSLTDEVMITEFDIIKQLRKSGTIAVRDLVQKLKEEFRMGPRNQEMLRHTLKKVVNHNKDAGTGVSVVMLKDEFK